MSALAGGGLTAAGFYAPAAMAAGGTPTTEASTTTTAAETTPQPTPEAPVTTPATTPTTTETASAPATTPAATPTSTVPTTTTPATTPAEVPTVVLQRPQKKSATRRAKSQSATSKAKTKAAEEAKAANKVATSPQAIASAGALAALLASSQSSVEALSFYRIPLFLLPVYKAAAVQYGVPWQILAAINEIETDYGADQSVSSAGAVGWMQFMPATWLQYGVDALDAGYADPYNPVDAVFAAARYLRAAGAETNLRGAILAYNHSEEYADSVLLRAKLISTYPKVVIATLTGLIDGRLPVSGTKVSWLLPEAQALSASTATAGASAVSPQSAAAEVSGSSASAATGSSSAVTPAAASTKAKTAAAKASPPLLATLSGSPDASVVAVQDGRIAHMGVSSSLGRYIVLRDVYGDLFTYAGLGSLAHDYVPPKAAAAPSSPVVQAASTKDPAPSQAASAGVQTPTTLSVKTPKAKVKATAASGQAALPGASGEAPPAGMGRVRLYAHPGNEDARAAAAVSAAHAAAVRKSEQRQRLAVGSVVPAGTVLGKVSTSAGSGKGTIRFAIRPAGDSATIDPGPILANWAELQTALHPQGARATDALLGATASDVFLLSKTELQRTVLSDPGITLGACERREVASGAADSRVLALLAFLSRSGLKPTVRALGCTAGHSAIAGQKDGDWVDISAIDGKLIAGHQGPGTITDLTIRTLLTLPEKFVPSSIASLMRYPGQSATKARSAFWNRIRLTFAPVKPAAALTTASVKSAAHSATTGAVAAAPVVTTGSLTASEWNQLLVRVAAIPAPVVASKPSSSAVTDPKTTRP